MTEFTISGLKLCNPPIEQGGSDIIAHLTLDYGPILFSGALLVHYRESGDYRVWLPGTGRRSKVVLRGRDNQIALADAALSAFKALGGKVAEMPVAKALIEEKLNDPSRDSCAA